MRLYDTAWVELDGTDVPVQVFKDPKNAGIFTVLGYQYDIDARPLKSTTAVPAIVKLHSLQSAREAREAREKAA